jgi:UDP-glucose 4-epimerase
MNWLITGGCGFIGSNLIRYLIKKGYGNIRVLDNLSIGSKQDLGRVCAFVEPVINKKVEFSENTDVQLIVGDILDRQLLEYATNDIDVMVHLAANTGVDQSINDPENDCQVNVMGTLNCLEAARSGKVGRFVFASSGAPVGECDPPIHEEKVPHPVSPYGASKLAGEGYCSAYFRSFDLETVALRFSNVYGPGSDHKFSVVANFIKKAFSGEQLDIFGDGAQTRDFIYIDDLVRAILLSAARKGVGGEIFQVATNQETSVSEIVEKIISSLALHGVTGIEINNTARRKGDVKRNFSDIRKAKNILGWQAEMMLDDGIDKTVEYFKQINSKQ